MSYHLNILKYHVIWQYSLLIDITLSSKCHNNWQYSIRTDSVLQTLSIRIAFSYTTDYNLRIRLFFVFDKKKIKNYQLNFNNNNYHLYIRIKTHYSFQDLKNINYKNCHYASF